MRKFPKYNKLEDGEEGKALKFNNGRCLCVHGNICSEIRRAYSRGHYPVVLDRRKGHTRGSEVISLYSSTQKVNS